MKVFWVANEESQTIRAMIGEFSEACARVRGRETDMAHSDMI